MPLLEGIRTLTNAPIAGVQHHSDLLILEPLEHQRQRVAAVPRHPGGVAGALCGRVVLRVRHPVLPDLQAVHVRAMLAMDRRINV